MKAYKGFDKDMKCRDFQFEAGKTYEEENAILCKKGFHACLAPLDVFRYYEPCGADGNLQNFHEVELDDVSEEKSDDSKVVAKKIKVGDSLDFIGLAKAHIEYVKNHLNSTNGITNTGDYSAASNTGRDGVALAWGINSKAKGALGCYLVLAEYGEWNGEEYPLINAKMHKVDGKTIKPDTWYKLKNGKFVEVKE